MTTTQTNTTNNFVTFAELCKICCNNLIANYRRPTTSDYINDHKLSTANPYERPQKAVYCVIRAKIRDSGLQMFIDLQNQQYTDRRALNEYTIPDRIATLQEKTKHLESMISDYANISADLTQPKKARNKALKGYKVGTRKVAQCRTEIEALTHALDNGTTFSDRQDLVHVAFIEDFTHRTNPAPLTIIYPVCHVDYMKYFKNMSIEQWAEVQAKANFSAVCKAVKKYMSGLPFSKTTDTVRKKYINVTTEEAEKWAKIYGGVGKEIKIHQPRKRTRESDCFATMEYDEDLKQWHKVMHYRTTAPITYLEQYTNEDGEPTLSGLTRHTAKESDPTAKNTSRADEGTQALKDFIKEYSPILTKNQAKFLEYFSSDEAIAEEQRAKEEYERTADKQTTEKADKYAFRCRRDFAFRMADIKTKSAQKTTISRLYDRIRPLKPKYTAPTITPIIIPSDYKTTAEHTYTHTAPSIADMITWHTDTTAEVKAVQWQTKAQAEQSRAEEQSRAKEQTAESKINNDTLWAEYTAHFSELRHTLHQANPNRQTLDRLTPKELEHYCTKLTKHRQRVGARAESQSRAEQRAKAEQERAKQKALADLIRNNEIHRAKDTAREELNRQGYNMTEYNNRKAIQHFKKSAPLSALVFMGA